ncbi:MAG: hypothetical protein AAGA25_14790 [Planctomycetota bacterium]
MSNVSPIQSQNFSNPPQHTGNTAPASSSDGFAKALTGLASVAVPVADTAMRLSTGGSTSLRSLGLGSIPGSNASGSQNADYMADLLAKQEEVQMRNMQFTTISNVSKTEHETRMSAVRNIRA